jgi:hypothetical protein
MALFNNQIIFNLLITLVVGAALYYYIKYKCRVLELTQREHAKVLQSVIMSMNNPRCQVRNINDMSGGCGVCSLDELPDINQDIERYKQVNNSELIDVSDDGDDSDDDSESDSGSGSDSDGDSGSESDDEESYNTKKIIIGGNIESQTIEHLTGPDVKVIELSHPLYPSHNENVVDNEDEGDSEADNDDDDDNDDEDDDDDNDDNDDNDEHNDNNDDDDGSDNNNINNMGSLEEVTSVVNGVEYLENLETVEPKLTTSDDNGNLKTDEISVKTIFKSNVSDTHQDFNGMNVQSLRQHYKQRLLIEGKNINEAAINKLTKKELIKNLQQ